MNISAIKKEIKNNGGEFSLQKRLLLNGKKCYRVNGVLLTKDQVIENYKMGAL